MAALAGVSVCWYTWLEQGRDIQASADTLRRVADVLQLDRIESTHLFALSARERPSFSSSEELSEGVSMLVQAINPLPAYVRNARFDILAWNAASKDLFVDYAILHPHERNVLKLLFLHQPYRSLVFDWEQTARGMIATFRAVRARAQLQAPFDELVDELCGSSPEFRAWWPDTDVKGFDEGSERLQHPKFGRIDLTYVSLAQEDRPDLSIVIYVKHPQPMTCSHMLTNYLPSALLTC